MHGTLTIRFGDDGFLLDEPEVHKRVDLEINDLRAEASNTAKTKWLHKLLYHPRIRTGGGNRILLSGMKPINQEHTVFASQEWIFEPTP